MSLTKTHSRMIEGSAVNVKDFGAVGDGVYLRINGTSVTSASSGGATALPANPQGYITVNINGVDRKIPYYV